MLKTHEKHMLKKQFSNNKSLGQEKLGTKPSHPINSTGSSLFWEKWSQKPNQHIDRDATLYPILELIWVNYNHLTQRPHHR